MAWFKRKKTPSSPQKPMRMGELYDIHAHILPNLDDGAQSMEEAVEILDGMASLGFEKIAVSPHFNARELSPNIDEQQTLIEEIKTKRDSKPPHLIPGAETHFDDFFISREAEGNIPSIAKTPTYLVEFPFGPGTVPLGVENVAFKFLLKDKNLILAHPERFSDFQNHMERLVTLHNGGMFLQLDVMSLVGKNGRRSKKTAYKLLEEGLVDLASTDIHRAKDLKVVESAMRALEEWDASEFQRLFSDNPRLLLEDRSEEVMQHE